MPLTALLDALHGSICNCPVDLLELIFGDIDGGFL